MRVGLGSEGGTPEGSWKVKNRLENPTYYPPASATDKRIIAPDDPNNPKGEQFAEIIIASADYDNPKDKKQHKKQDHRHRPDKPHFFADDRKDKIGMACRQVKKLLPGMPQPHAAFSGQITC